MNRIDYDIVQGNLVESRINRFMRIIDDIMIPRLSGRVNIDDYSKKIASNAITVFAIENGFDIGSVSIYCNRCDAYITSVAVLEEYGRQGIGSSLLRVAFELAMQNKCKSISLEVFDDNENAISFYLKNGYKIVSKKNRWIEMKNYINSEL